LRFADSISMTSSGSAARSYSIEANSFQPFAVDVAAKSPLALDDRMLLVELHAAWIASTDGAVEKESLLALVKNPQVTSGGRLAKGNSTFSAFSSAKA
jgi:hypothetical protein